MANVNYELLEKLRSLKEMTARGGTYAECQTAGMLLQKLMTKHNLSMSEIDIDRDGVVEAKHTFDHEGFRKGLIFLFSAIMKANHCSAIRITPNGKETEKVIFGNPSAVRNAKILYEFLEAAIVREAISEALRNGKKKTLAEAMTAFVEGASIEIGNRLKASIEEEENASASKDLVLLMDAKARNALVNRFPNVRDASYGRTSSHKSGEAGRAFGKSVHLGGQISAKGRLLTHGM